VRTSAPLGSDPDWGLLLSLTMITGRRRGEVSGLRWRHVDFERGQLIVEKNTVQPRADVIEKDTKSGSQPRLALDPQTLTLLAEHRERAAGRCAALGIGLSDNAYLFSLSPEARHRTSRGRSASATDDSPRRRGCAAPASMPFGTTPRPELIAAGVDVRTVTGRLGQSGGGGKQT
jgi:integrase